MKTHTKIGLAALFVLALAGCKKEPTGPSQFKGGFKVETLFTHEGCTVYRFEDDRTIYFTKCEGAASSSAIPIQNCGKSCYRPEPNETEYGQ